MIARNIHLLIVTASLSLPLFCGCSSQPRYQKTNRPPFTFDTKMGFDCWAKVSSPEREKARAAYAADEAANRYNPLSSLDDPIIAAGQSPVQYDPRDYPYCSDLLKP